MSLYMLLRGYLDILALSNESPFGNQVRRRSVFSEVKLFDFHFHLSTNRSSAPSVDVFCAVRALDITSPFIEFFRCIFNVLPASSLLAKYRIEGG
jgi:hypothetical protein